MAAREVDPKLPTELRYPEAAVMRMAPGSRLLPCRSVSCCWRWATAKLVDECTALKADVHHLRTVLEEELGDSALQKLLKLQQEHASLAGKCQNTQRLLDAERGTVRTLREDLARAAEARDEAQANEESAVTRRRKAEELTGGLRERIEALTEELRAALERTPEALEQKLAEAHECLEQTRERAEDKAAQHKRDLAAELDKNCALTYKLKELRAHETKMLAKKKKLRRENRV